ncbi:MAG: YybH family protein [Nitrososphaerales archaeon]
MKFIPAYKPEDCDRLIVEAIEKGDIESSVALYESDAVLFTGPDELIKGQDAIRKQNEKSIALKSKFIIHNIKTVMSGDGSIATTRMKITSIDVDPKNGKEVRYLMNTLEVVRKQPDGSWRFVIDDPFGGNRANM